SGLGDGFGSHLSIHMWRMATHEGALYVGTLDDSSKWRRVPGSGANMGFDLYATTDGWFYTRVTRTAFSAPGVVDVFDQGVRTLASTPYGLFVGAANPFHGLNIWRGSSGPPGLESPQRLESEVVGDSVVLSWEQPDGASTFH